MFLSIAGARTRGEVTPAGMKDTHPSRRSYTRETKLKVVRWYSIHGCNLYQTCKKFELNSKTVLRWSKDETKIKHSKKGQKCVKFDRTALFPGMEDTSYEEYRSLRQRGVKVKGWWFKTRAKQLLQDTREEESQFKFSNAWFSGFKRRYKIRLRRPTNKAQHIPTDKRELIQNFH